MGGGELGGKGGCGGGCGGGGGGGEVLSLQRAYAWSLSELTNQLPSKILALAELRVAYILSAQTQRAFLVRVSLPAK